LSNYHLALFALPFWEIKRIFGVVVATCIFSFLKLPKKTDRKPRIRYSDLVKERSDIELEKENGVVGQQDRIRSLRKNGEGRKSEPDRDEPDSRGPNQKKS